MKESSKKYRSSQEGKDTTRILQKKYAVLNKLNNNYNKNINIKQRERYKKNKELKKIQDVNENKITILLNQLVTLLLLKKYNCILLYIV